MAEQQTLSGYRLFICSTQYTSVYTQTGGNGSSIDGSPMASKYTTILCRTNEQFWADMKGTYRDDLTLDRTDNNKPYCKSNCEWVTIQVQLQNRSTTKIKRGEIDSILEPLYALNGIERSVQLKILAEMYDVSISTIRTHYNRMLETKGYK